MKQELKIIRKGLERISVRGREDIDLMGMCMDALDTVIESMGDEKENKNEDD